MPCAESARCLAGASPPFHWAWAARRLRPRSVPCPTFRLLAWGVTPLLAWHALRWERKLPYRGVPPFPMSLTARRGRGRSAPPPSCPRAVCARGWGGGGGPPGSGPRLTGGSGGLCLGDPPVPLLRASGARCWSGLYGCSRLARAAVRGGSLSTSSLTSQ